MTQQTSATQPPPPVQHGDALDRLFAAARLFGVVRGAADKWFGGVCAGLARRWNVDPLIVRAGFLLATVLFGIGIPAYFLAWILLPDEAGEIVVEKAVRHGHASSIVLCVVAAAVSFGGFGVFWSIGSGWGVFGQAVGLAFLAWAFLAWNGHGPGARRPDESTSDWGNRLSDAMRNRQTDAAATPSNTPMPPRAQAGPQPEPSIGNRAAAAGAAARDGRIDLTKQATVTPTAPTAPVRLKRRRLGVALSFAIIGISVLAGAFTALVLVGTSHGDSALQVGLAAGAAVAALALVIGGLAGRRGGALGPLATVVALVALLTSAALPTGMPWTGRIGDQSWRPTSVAPGTQHNFAMRVGDGKLDLRDVGGTGLAAHTHLNTRVNVGQLTITVPADTTVRVKGYVNIGGIEVVRGGQHLVNYGGVDTHRTVTVGTGSKVIDLDARVGIGNITIKEQS
ncbi:PspC domain-containing protein [Flexivirga alba]|uniref:PspC domain-containing protein n=1 Tax=Flexivirga alba TaxID=702742 RepID=A0ABW2ANC8_9MICO